MTNQECAWQLRQVMRVLPSDTLPAAGSEQTPMTDEVSLAVVEALRALADRVEEENLNYGGT